MSQSDRPISQLRQRMIDDMTLRKLGDKTQSAYIRAVRFLAVYLRRSPDTASAEDLRAYQLHMVQRGVSAVSINAATGPVISIVTVTMPSASLSYLKAFIDGNLATAIGNPRRGGEQAQARGIVVAASVERARGRFNGERKNVD